MPSAASLSHAARLKEQHGLANLELRHLPIERASDLGCDFGLIYATGVLHHMADPRAGLAALGRLLKPLGVIQAMVYAKVGRFGINLMRELFRRVGAEQTPEGIALVRDTLARLSPEHPVARMARDLQKKGFISESETVDMFLHAREDSFSVRDCFDLVAGSGLKFQRWYDTSLYTPELHFPEAAPVYQALLKLDDQTLALAMESVVAHNWMHEFVACRPERPPQGYTVDFNDAEVSDFVPVKEWNLTLDDGPSFTRWGTRIAITDVHAAIVCAMDGRNTIGEIAQNEGTSSDFTAKAVWSLWRMGCVAIRIPGIGRAGAHGPTNRAP